MSEKKLLQFPDVGNKLQAPSKKSLFERQKADAEAKRLREEAETKAVLDEFVKSFDEDDDEDEDAGRSGYGAPQRAYGGSRGSGAPLAGRGFGGDRGRPGASGPGTLGPPHRSMGMGKNRPLKTFQQGGFQQGGERQRNERAMLGFDDDNERASPGPSRSLKRDLDYDDDRDRPVTVEEEKAAAKPTLRLSLLPPGTSPAVIKALLPSNLTVDAIRIQPPPSLVPYGERKSMSAIVTLAKDTASSDIDAAVVGLQNRYLGYGFYLNLHRHLSSAVNASSAPISGPGMSVSGPFGAKPVPVAPAAGRGHAPPPGFRANFAPPTSYGPSQPNRGPLLHVPVQPPQDIKELKLIHKVIESLITHGPEFEALLMTRPEVQREVKWAWLWDSKSAGGVWYRWRLWEVLTGTQTKRGQGKYLPLFEGSSAWKQPDQPLAWEYTTRLEEFVSDSEYNSSDEEDSGDEGARRPNHGGGPPDANILTDDGSAYLNPLERAKLTHLLSRLPTSTGQLRKGDVARITAFAISHAGRGADEIVAAIISNIEKPFAYTSANPDRKKGKETGEDASPEVEDTSDTSNASLIALFIVSDLLSASSASGVNRAWRYRQLFEVALKQRHTFEGLGRMERTLKWGRLRAEKWKRSISNILSLWEGWCVFPAASQEHFVKVFNNPPMTATEEREAKEKEELVKEDVDKGKGRWKAVEVERKEDVDGEAMAVDDDDMDGEPMEEDDDVDGEPMAEDDDVDGEPMEDGDGEPMEESPPTPPKAEIKIADASVMVDASPVQQRKRPKAVDMFADSDDED